MKKTIKKEEIKVYCDYCSKEVKQGVSFDTVDKDDIILFEKKKEYKRYESFHMPQRKEVSFCNAEHAKKWCEDQLNKFICTLTR